MVVWAVRPLLLMTSIFRSVAHGSRTKLSARAQLAICPCAALSELVEIGILLPGTSSLVWSNYLLSVNQPDD